MLPVAAQCGRHIAPPHPTRTFAPATSTRLIVVYCAALLYPRLPAITAVGAASCIVFLRLMMGNPLSSVSSRLLRGGSALAAVAAAAAPSSSLDLVAATTRWPSHASHACTCDRSIGDQSMCGLEFLVASRGVVRWCSVLRRAQYTVHSTVGYALGSFSSWSIASTNAIGSSWSASRRL